MIDLLTSNRDKVVWEAAQGRAVKADDSNLPDFIPVSPTSPVRCRGASTSFSAAKKKSRR